MSIYNNKNILLVSPQKWSHIPVSKHHYANELVSRGAHVLFLQPPLNVFGRSQVKMTKINSGLTIAQPLVGIPKVMKFRFPKWYFKSIGRTLSNWTRQIRQIDIIWNFDNGNYFDIANFINSDINIFHPVDMINGDLDSTKYDIIFSVSNSILERIQHHNKYFINHGLSNDFLSGVQKEETESKTKKIGYVGNINHPSFNLDWFRSLVEGNKDVQFHVWGPNVDNEESLAILKRPNVFHHGIARGENLFNSISQMNCLIILYRKSNTYAMDNSHKILEYLATGRPVISTPISQYSKSPWIIFRSNIEDYMKAIREVLNCDRKIYNEEQVNFARSNSYENQLNRIERYLLNL